MNKLAEIKIKVPLEVAENYWNKTEQERQQIEHKINFFLQSTTFSREQLVDKLYETMDKIGQKAIEQGLTPEILESILNEDE
jgi:hypothetical protein